MEEDIIKCFVNFIVFFSFQTEMPASMLPVLEIDGKTHIPQSMAIARYLAREFGKSL